MIERTKSYKCSDGSVFLNEAEAQMRELQILLGVTDDETSVNNGLNNAISAIVAKKAEVLAILASRKPRTVKTKTAKAKKEQVAA